MRTITNVSFPPALAMALERNFGGIAFCGNADHPAGRSGRDEIG
jgi:hypothetical protein